MFASGKNILYHLLRWSERYFKTDMVYLASGGFWLLVTQGVSVIAGIISAIAFANLLDPELYGNYKYLLSVFAILSGLTLTGLHPSLVSAISRGDDQFFPFARKTILKWGVLMSLTAIVGGLYYLYNDNVVLALSLLGASIVLPAISVLGLYAAFLNGKREFWRISLFSSLGTTLHTAAIVGILFFTDNILWLIGIYLVGLLLSNAIPYLITLRKFSIPEKDSLSKKERKDALTFSFQYSLLSLFNTAIGQLDKILLFQTIGGAALATYTFAYAPVAQFRGLLKTATPLALTKLAAATKESVRESLPGKMFRLTVVLIVPVALYILAAPYIFKFLFPAYTEAVIYSQVLALALLMFPKKLISIAMTAHAEGRSSTIVSVGSAIIRLSLILLLIPQFGIWGAVFAELGSHLGTNILANYQLKKMK